MLQDSVPFEFSDEESERVGKAIENTKPGNRCRENPELQRVLDQNFWNKSVESIPEKRINHVLKVCRIKFRREASFEGCMSNKGHYLRFDFYLLEHNVLIEYNGKEAHKSKAVKERDQIKKDFCAAKNVRLVIFDKKHWFKLEWHLVNLLNEYLTKKIVYTKDLMLGAKPKERYKKPKPKRDAGNKKKEYVPLQLRGVSNKWTDLNKPLTH